MYPKRSQVNVDRGSRTVELEKKEYVYIYGISRGRLEEVGGWYRHFDKWKARGCLTYCFSWKFTLQMQDNSYFDIYFAYWFKLCQTSYFKTVSDSRRPVWNFPSFLQSFLPYPPPPNSNNLPSPFLSPPTKTQIMKVGEKNTSSFLLPPSCDADKVAVPKELLGFPCKFWRGRMTEGIPEDLYKVCATGKLDPGEGDPKGGPKRDTSATRWGTLFQKEHNWISI